MATSIMTCLAVIVGIMLAYSDDIKKSKDNDEKKYNVISIGFSQVGAESGWRTGNSISMKNTFSSKKGYDLIFNDAQQQQEQQIKAIRSFIQQGVDYIVLAPVVETGWDTVLEEAEAAKIPVIVEDRRVEVKDDSLYTTWVGADFYTEGQKACNWLEQYADRKNRKSLNIVHIMGTEGATAQVGRTKALEEAAAKNGWTILEEANGEFTQAKGQEVMKRFLQQYKDIDVVYCDNDNEALGAVTAIKEAGKTLGPEGIPPYSNSTSVHYHVCGRYGYLCRQRICKAADVPESVHLQCGTSCYCNGTDNRNDHRRYRYLCRICNSSGMYVMCIRHGKERHECLYGGCHCTSDRPSVWYCTGIPGILS